VFTKSFFFFLKKCQDDDHFKFGEALHFYIHPSFEPKNTFLSYSYTFSSKSGDFIYIFFYKNRRLLFSGEKKTFMLKWCFLAYFAPPKGLFLTIQLPVFS